MKKPISYRYNSKNKPFRKNPGLKKIAIIIFATVFIAAGVFIIWQSYASTGYLRVMSWNLRYGGVRANSDVSLAARTISNKIKDLNNVPEVIFLQETYQDSYGNRDLTQKIASNLNMSYKFAATVPNNSYGNPNEDNRQSRNGLDYGIAVLSKYPLQNVSVIDLPSPSSEPRKAILAYIRLRNGSTVRIIGTHLSSAGQDEEANRENRPCLYGIKIDQYNCRNAQVRAIINSSSDRMFTIVGGDMNTEPNEPPIERFGNNGYGGKFNLLTLSTSRPTKQVDYILGRNLPLGTTARTFIPDGFGSYSDHFPIVTDFSN
jgi:endonuclease/exonuclease/phosphatase family metal-dependent hydrolase